jgi:hypothetical protein
VREILFHSVSYTIRSHLCRESISRFFFRNKERE